MKQTVEAMQAELKKLEASLEACKAAGVEVPEILKNSYDNLLKKLAGNSNQQTAEILNNTIAKTLNDPTKGAKPEFFESLITASGGKAKLQIVITKTEATEEGGKPAYAVSFEAASGSSSGSTGGTGRPRESSAYNHFVVALKPTEGEAYDKLVALGYKTEAQAFDTAAGALRYILNEGKNPMNLAGDYGKSNSAVRVLEEALPKNKDFEANFTVELSKVEKAEKKAEPAAGAIGVGTSETPATEGEQK